MSLEMQERIEEARWLPSRKCAQNRFAWKSSNRQQENLVHCKLSTAKCNDFACECIKPILENKR